MHTVFDIA